MAEATQYNPIKPRPDGMLIDFKRIGNIVTIVTFTEVEDHAFKLTFHQLLPDGERHDLLYRNTDPTYSGSVYEEQCIIVRENLLINEDTAIEIWEYLTGSKDSFMSDAKKNDEGKNFSELKVEGDYQVRAVIHYLERIAISLHDQEKRKREQAAAAHNKEVRAARDAQRREDMKAFKLTPQYQEQMEMERLEKQRLNDEAAAAAAARRAQYDALPAAGTTRSGKPTSGRGGTRRPSRKYKKSKRVLRRKSRSTRRR